MALVVEDIVKNFGEGLSETKVLKGINFEVKTGITFKWCLWFWENNIANDIWRIVKSNEWYSALQ